MDKEELANLSQPLNPGIVNLVTILNEHGFKTCDSGDGVTHDHECDRDYPYVVVMSDKTKLIEDTDRLMAVLYIMGVEVVPFTLEMDKPGYPGKL